VTSAPALDLQPPPAPPPVPPLAAASERAWQPQPGEPACPYAIAADRRYRLENRTPRRIHLTADADMLDLSPLSQRVICGARLQPFEYELKRLRQLHRLSVREYEVEGRGSRLPITVLWLSILALLVIVATDLLAGGTLLSKEALVGVVITVFVILIVLAVAATSERRRRAREDQADSAEGDIDFGVGGAFYDGNETLRRTKYIFTFLVVLLIGAVLPAIAIFVATDAKEFVAMHGGLHVLAAKESRLASRLIQVVYTAVLSLFPALLYFQFDRQRVGMIRGSWTRAIFRMDKRMETISDVNARYGDKLSDASSYSTDSVRFLGGRNSPIIVATILLSVGWTILVIRTDSFDFAAAARVGALAQTAEEAADRAQNLQGPAAQAAAELAQAASQEATRIAAESVGITVPPIPPVPSDAAASAESSAESSAAASAESSAVVAGAARAAVRQPFFQLLVPTPTAATMAFLGAYFFGVYLVLGGYFRGDLRPKIYNQITARLVTVVVLAYLISALFSEGGQRNRYIWALAFVAGIVPTTVLQQIGVLASSIFRPLQKGDSSVAKAFSVAFAAPRPLTDIDGIDLREASRLESEGIPDIPSLAQTDLVSAMVNTRLPIERLIDWTDQAILLLHLDEGRDEKLDNRIEALRQVGVRTASELLAMVGADEPHHAAPSGSKECIERIVTRNGAHPISLELLVDELKREPAMGRILEWHHSELADVSEPWPRVDCDDTVTAAAT